MLYSEELPDASNLASVLHNKETKTNEGSRIVYITEKAAHQHAQNTTFGLFAAASLFRLSGWFHIHLFLFIKNHSMHYLILLKRYLSSRQYLNELSENIHITYRYIQRSHFKWSMSTWSRYRYATLTLMLLVANLANYTQLCKNPEKSLKPWHMGTHLRVLGEGYPMSTNMTRFRWFQRSLRSCALGKSSLSIGRVKVISYPHEVKMSARSWTSTARF